MQYHLPRTPRQAKAQAERTNAPAEPRGAHFYATADAHRAVSMGRNLNFNAIVQAKIWRHAR